MTISLGKRWMEIRYRYFYPFHVSFHKLKDGYLIHLYKWSIIIKSR